MNRLTIAVFLSCLHFTGMAQWHQNVAVSPQLTYGKIIKHSSKILYDIPAFSYGVSANIVYRTFGKQYWNSWQKYPELGVQLGYMNLGDQAVLGNAFSVLPNISLKLLGGQETRFDFMVGTGIAYLTKKFNYTKNPNQTAIGSNVNNITLLQFNLHHHITTSLKAIAGFGLTHYSNGSSSLPNLGINLLTAQAGIQWIPQPVDGGDYTQSSIDPKPDRRFGLTTHLSLAFVEQALPGGPKYPVYIASLGGIYRLSKAQQIIIGTELEYHLSDYYFLLRSTEANDEKTARNAARRHLIFVADEFFFWPFSLVLQAGTYLDTDYQYNFGKIYTKLSTRYYFKPFGKPKTRIYAGVHLKAHKLAAEYISLGIGAML